MESSIAVHTVNGMEMKMFYLDSVHEEIWTFELCNEKSSHFIVIVLEIFRFPNTNVYVNGNEYVNVQCSSR